MELHHPPELSGPRASLADEELRLLADGGPRGRRTGAGTAPPLHRRSMAPRPWHGQRAGGTADRPPETGGRSRWPGMLRRTVLLLLVIAQTWIATDFMAGVLPYQGRQPLEIAILVLFAVLFGWISAGFWTAMAGLALVLRGGDRHGATTAAGQQELDRQARVAVVMPVCNEDVARVFAGLRATFESVGRTPGQQHFDFYVLSDSRADTRAAEARAWLDLCRAVDGFGRVFYRWRRHHIKRKSGNIADFCRRWGSRYRYMVIMDADSVMSGECLVRLLRMMESNPDAGIIQTSPRAAGRDTLYARVQQFSTGVYGPMFTAGLHFWQLGESHYWGHNAIIRIAPFMQHCALARLPGNGPLSGEILSHDFVEAALMRRAGWKVWIAWDVPGSYEETPPNLVDELTRDRRWCQGNLMNFRLFSLPGLHPAHRVMFVTGVMAYCSAALWFLLLILSTALLAVHMLAEPQYFVRPYQLFPLWPEWHPGRAIALFSTTATLLFLPKLASILAVGIRDASRHGGGLRLALSALGELALSALLAPIRMLFHTQFVLAPLFGRTVRWKSPPRDDAETGWGEAVRRHGWHTLLGIAWAGLVYWLNPMFLWWLLPVVGALILSIPLSAYTSRVTPGRRLRDAGFLMTPEESQPPLEIARVRELMRKNVRPSGKAASASPASPALAHRPAAATR